MTVPAVIGPAMIGPAMIGPPPPWVSGGVLLGAFLLWLGALKLYQHFRSPDPEHLRKLLHTGSGLLTLSFPWLFDTPTPAILLCAASASLLLAVKVIPAFRRELGQVVDGVDRETLGEVYFPIAVALLFVLAHGRDPLLFTVPILILSLADAVSALIGARYGQVRFTGSNKSLEGSIAFFVTAFFSVHVPLVLFGSAGRVETLLISLILAFLVMLLEGCAWRGLDNLFIPIGAFFLLRAYLDMDATALTLRLIVIVAAVLLVLVWRTRTTLDDSALLAGVFIGYVTWALAGRRWLVPPVVVFLVYTLLSPRTAENSRRVHDPYALLSVCAAGLAWLAAARAFDRPDFYFPYTLAFACQLGLIGMARLAFDRPDMPLAALAAICTVRASLLVLTPFVILAGATSTALTQAGVGVAAIALAVSVFAAIQPQIRNCPADAARWLRQGAIPGLASLVGLLV
jgi:phytol kinase